jgi:two-component system osmolarity sensor histidine kinase EnvZ
MANDIEQVTAIIDKFLDYARAEHVVMAPVMLDEVITAALQPYIGAPDCRIVSSVPSGCQVMADAVELRRVIDNLLENASRYGRSADQTLHIDLSVAMTPPWVVLTLSDHGAGVPHEILPRLVEPFFRANEARTAATGSGLGLAIAQKTVQRMGGQLLLQRAPSGGLMVTIRLQTVTPGRRAPS